jgi:hypothetical protein
MPLWVLKNTPEILSCTIKRCNGPTTKVNTPKLASEFHDSKVPI